MYAVGHISAGLAVKKRFPTTPLIALLIAVQASEILWMVFSYMGAEYTSVDARGILHLNSLGYSHSLLSGFGLGFLAWAIVAMWMQRPKVGLALAIAAASHVVLDVIQHEPNIQIASFISQPLLGLGLGTIPWLDFVVETAFGIACWKYFGGSKKLLAAILFLNLTNLPLMFSGQGGAGALANNHFILPTVVLVQTLMAWALVWPLARKHGRELATAESVEPATAPRAELRTA